LIFYLFAFACIVLLFFAAFVVILFSLSGFIFLLLLVFFFFSSRPSWLNYFLFDFLSFCFCLYFSSFLRGLRV